MTPIPSAVAKVHVHPKLYAELTSVGYTPDTVTFQSRVESRTALGGITYVWQPETGYVNLVCYVATTLPTENHRIRTENYIEELSFRMVALNGYYPGISPAWRAVIGSTGEILDILGVIPDSQHTRTNVEARLAKPSAEPGV